MEMERRKAAGGAALVALLALTIGGFCCGKPSNPAADIGIHNTAPPSGAANAAPAPAVPPSSAPDAAPAVPAAAPAAEIVVHVTGAVKKPGVYRLPSGSRGDDAVKAAGGPAKDASPDTLNLAAHLEDGSQIHVPTHQEALKPVSRPSPDNFIQHDTPAPPKESKPGTPPHSAAPPRSGSPSGRSGRSGSHKLTPGSGGSVNINTADAEELQKLPGIGPSMAERILEYRKENGGFKSTEELMQVSGIGAKKYAKIEPFLKIK